MSNRILRFPEVRNRVGGVTNVTLWRWEKDGSFPKRIRIGGNSAGWLESEIDDWIEKKAAGRKDS